MYWFRRMMRAWFYFYFVSVICVNDQNNYSDAYKPGTFLKEDFQDFLFRLVGKFRGGHIFNFPTVSEQLRNTEKKLQNISTEIEDPNPAPSSIFSSRTIHVLIFHMIFFIQLFNFCRNNIYSTDMRIEEKSHIIYF